MKKGDVEVQALDHGLYRIRLVSCDRVMVVTAEDLLNLRAVIMELATSMVFGGRVD